MMNKFYNFNFNNNETDLYLYGSIVSEKWEESDITFKDFKDKLDKVPNDGILNIYQNSCGGDCFVASSICSLIKRAQNRGVKVVATIDSLSASASSWISCVADELRVYDHSIMMLHKPLAFIFDACNADYLTKQIEVLDKLQNDVMLPMYMSKAKEGITEEMIQELVNKESWLGADEIENYFNVTRLEGETKVVASIDKDLLNKYKNVPKELKETEEPGEQGETTKELEEEKEVVEDVSKDVEEEPETTEENEPGEETEEQEEDEEAKKELQNKLKILNLELELINLF